MLMGLRVQVLAADGAKSRAVRTAQDLLGKLEGDRVARPGPHLQVVVRDVIGAKVIGERGVRVVELPRRHAALDLSEAEAAHTRAGELHLKAQVEHGRARRLGDLEVDGDTRRRGLVALAAEQEGLELDLEPLATHLAWTKVQPAKIDRRHPWSVASDDGDQSRLAVLLVW